MIIFTVVLAATGGGLCLPEFVVKVWFCVGGCFRRRFGVGSGVLVLRFDVAGVGVLVADLLLFSLAADLVFTFDCFWRW